jgi:DNA-binding response OmpR family regulator
MLFSARNSVKKIMAKILIIDDDENFRGTLIATLEKHGFTVFEAPGGARGVQLARDLRPDVILCDVNMDGADGRLTLFALRRDPEVASIPFVLMSGQDLSGEALPGTGRGADGFLVKPFPQKKLIATIEGCLSRVEQTPNSVERIKVVHNDPPAASTKDGLLQQIIEATGQISVNSSQIAPGEVERLGKLAHQSALRLKNLLEEQAR